MKTYAKTPTILQMEATECGAASLAMVMAYYGHYVPLERMRIETAVSRDGVNAADILRAAKRYGLSCHGYRKNDVDALREVPMPCVIHWNFNHFVVLEGFKGRFAYLNDPAVGRRKLTIEELDEGFTGVVLTFEKTDAFVARKKVGRVLPFIVSRLRTQVPVLFKLIYIGFLLIVPGLALPVVSRVFIDDVLTAGYHNWLARLLLFMGACLLLKEGLDYYRSLILAKFKSKMTLISGYRFLSHMMRLPIAFFSQRYAGDLVDRLEDNDEINSFLAGDLAENVLNIFTALFYLGILCFYSPWLTLIGLLSVAVSLTVALMANRVIGSATIKLKMTGGKLYGAVCAGLSITDTIKASGIEMEYSNRLVGHQALYATQEQKMKRFSQIVGAIPDAMGRLVDVLILMVGGLLVMRGRFTVGMLVAFNSLFDSFCAPINELMGFFEKLQKMKSNINRVDDIERYPAEETAPKSSTVSKQKLTGRVELRDVSYGYSPQKPPIVSDFCFHLYSGESVAFVGPSGCGKSTISNVVSGLYHAWSGDVLFDDVPIGEIPPAVLHASVAMVSQNIVLFSGTIRDNLTMWNPTIREQDMIAAAKDACIHDFIMQQSGGYDYRLSENAVNLSGGQRQRLEIARALAVNPSVLIMDEATSALDPIVEKNIMDNIRKRGCTCIIVAHRLSAIRDCNEIIVMSGGKIVERGTHESLKQLNGFYSRFIRDT